MEMESLLKRYFGYCQFRPYQKEIIEKVLDGRDCLVVMATGSGKSLCYQIPPLVKGKTAVIISPLLSLMHDQVMCLKQRDIKAEYLGSTQTNQSASSDAEKGVFHILYMTPEKACSLPARFWTNLLNAGVSLLAVDEAHCISEWGHNFRKEYKQLHMLRDFLINVPFVALTATATEKVRTDIICSLTMTNPYIAIGSFDRQNLFYGVKSCNRSMSFLDDLVKEVTKYNANSGSTIIYCTTIKDTEQIYDLLSTAGIKAGMYHGQMSNKTREKAHRYFITDEISVMVATIAFGMGIDKPNVRCVIHYGCPKSIESYYQESGRCGRDGLPSICWLYYSRSDFGKADFYCAEAQNENQRKAIMESFLAAQKYCFLGTCRRKFLLQYFGEKTLKDCGNCDNCTVSKMERDLSTESFLLLSCIKSCGGRWGLNMPIDILRGSRAKKIVDNKYDELPLHGLGKEHSPNWWKVLGGMLIAHGFLKENVQETYRCVSVSSRGVQFLCTANTINQIPLVLALTEEMIDEEEHGGAHNKVGDLHSLARLQFEEFSEAESKFYHALLNLRMRLAKDSRTAPYAICGDQTIKKITKIRPSTRARLANIDGINQHLVTKYGDIFLQNISQLSQKLNLHLDGAMPVQITAPKEICSNSQRKASNAKLDAWRMWQSDGLSFLEIANFPGRPAPIKELTVISYIHDAAREGCEINWGRFCEEIGLTFDIVSLVRSAIAKVGSSDRLKPIKEELPENVSYEMIRTFLTMEALGVPAERMLASTSTEDASVKAPESADPCILVGETREEQKGNGENCLSREAAFDSPQNNQKSFCARVQSSAMKRPHEVLDEEKHFETLEATENSVLEYIKGRDGVSLAEIGEHFGGSKKAALVLLLDCLEGEFLVYKKNGLYMAM